MSDDEDKSIRGLPLQPLREKSLVLEAAQDETIIKDGNLYLHTIRFLSESIPNVFTSDINPQRYYTNLTYIEDRNKPVDTPEHAIPPQSWKSAILAGFSAARNMLERTSRTINLNDPPNIEYLASAWIRKTPSHHISEQDNIEFPVPLMQEMNIETFMNRISGPGRRLVCIDNATLVEKQPIDAQLPEILEAREEDHGTARVTGNPGDSTDIAWTMPPFLTYVLALDQLSTIRLLARMIRYFRLRFLSLPTDVSRDPKSQNRTTTISENDEQTGSKRARSHPDLVKTEALSHQLDDIRGSSEPSNSSLQVDPIAPIVAPFDETKTIATSPTTKIDGLGSIEGAPTEIKAPIQTPLMVPVKPSIIHKRIARSTLMLSSTIMSLLQPVATSATEEAFAQEVPASVAANIQDVSCIGSSEGGALGHAMAGAADLDATSAQATENLTPLESLRDQVQLIQDLFDLSNRSVKPSECSWVYGLLARLPLPMLHDTASCLRSLFMNMRVQRAALAKALDIALQIVARVRMAIKARSASCDSSLIEDSAYQDCKFCINGENMDPDALYLKLCSVRTQISAINIIITITGTFFSQRLPDEE